MFESWLQILGAVCLPRNQKPGMLMRRPPSWHHPLPLPSSAAHWLIAVVMDALLDLARAKPASRTRLRRIYKIVPRYRYRLVRPKGCDNVSTSGESQVPRKQQLTSRPKQGVAPEG